MAAFNRLIVAGNLTRDPKISYVNNGTDAVTKFSIAINRRTKQREEVMYLDVVAWGKLGETLNTYLAKGDPVLLEGRLAINKYVDNDGNARTGVQIIVSGFSFLKNKNEGSSNGSGGGSSEREQTYAAADTVRVQGGGASPTATRAAYRDYYEGDDEVPF